MKIEQVKMEDSNDGKKRKSTILNMQIEKSGEIWTGIDEKQAKFEIVQCTNLKENREGDDNLKKKKNVMGDNNPTCPNNPFTQPKPHLLKPSPLPLNPIPNITFHPNFYQPTPQIYNPTQI